MEIRPSFLTRIADCTQEIIETVRLPQINAVKEASLSGSLHSWSRAGMMELFLPVFHRLCRVREFFIPSGT